MRPISLAACLAVAAPASFGLPQDAVPSFGQTTVRQTAPNQLDIVQSTQRAGIDWTSFSIAAGEKVVVTQPGTSSVLLNRVLGNDPSQIFGSLQSNGSVWLVNPRGIVFGAGSRVDVGGLLASTLSITNEDAASGRLVLGRGAGTAGELRSEGQITAPNGNVILVAPQLTHSGSIDARRVGLAAATDVTVDIEGDGLIFFNLRNDGTLDTRLSLLGNVLADGGLAEMRAAARAGFADTVLNMDGIVQARSLG
ncbi:MAG: filamentous hemagglutinin N-terminal domain-containing protein, partial [Rubrivivax sp.]